MAVQLIGVTWDALLHYSDADLAAKEGVLSLSNPAHLMLALGQGVTIAGVLWGLSRSSVGQSGRRSRRRVTPLMLILALLSLGAASAAFATRSSGGHDAPGGPTQGIGRQASAHGHGVGDAGAYVAADDPTWLALRGVLVAEGTGSALRRLEKLAARDVRLHAVAHAYAHELGRFSYNHYRQDVAAAFGRCNLAVQGACYHGLLQAYFADRGTPEPRTLRRLCAGTLVRRSESLPRRFECLHGLGHGLALTLPRGSLTPLRYCDFLRTRREHSYCYSGVFMQAILGHRSLETLGQLPELARPTRTSRPGTDARYYPCESLATRYRWRCYETRPLVVLSENPAGFPDAFADCGDAPKAYIGACNQGVGIAIVSFSDLDPRKSRDLCMLSQRAYREQCFVGAARMLVSAYWKTRAAFKLCNRAPVDAKRGCFRTIGQRLRMLQPDQASRERQCGRAVGARWVAVCRRSPPYSTPGA